MTWLYLMPSYTRGVLRWDFLAPGKMAENPDWHARKCLISWIILCLNFYTDFNTFLVISWQSITYTVIPNFSASDRLVIPHDFWISGERQNNQITIIRLNVWDQCSWRNNASLYHHFFTFDFNWITCSIVVLFFYHILLLSLFSNMKLKWIIIVITL